MPRLPAQLTYNDLNGSEATEILVDWFRQLLAQQPLLQPHLTLPMSVLRLDLNIGIDMYNGGTQPVTAPPEHLEIPGTVTLTNTIPGAPAGQAQHTEYQVSTEVNAAPIPGGQPPDAVRAAHGLNIPRPGFGPRETGSHIFLSDGPATPPFKPNLDTIAQETSARAAAQPRSGIVAEGYTFSPEAPSVQVSEQVIPVDKGAIQVKLDGAAIRHAGIEVSAGTHISSVKTLGDQAGKPYESVNGVYDAGPAGLMQPGRRGGGMYSDGRSRISFGNSHRG